MSIFMLSQLYFVIALVLFTHSVSAQKYVFAHVVVGNTAAHTQLTWQNDVTLAQKAGIDAFALNCGYPDSNIPTQVANAFAAATALGSTFKLFFSFDYPGGGQPWPAATVASYLNKYKTSPAYFNFSGMPFASTFEGTSNIADWAPGGPIRSAVGNVYFVPDWTSLGQGGISSHLSNIQGFFSWDMWPNGATNMTMNTDRAWQAAIGNGKTYMMGVSPWFFHSASGGTEWVWRGDDLWADRWAQTLEVQPTFVQIVTWNDYGESHYVGPLPPSSSEIPQGSVQYVTPCPHDSWRDFLPYYIAAFKGSSFTIQRDQIQYWYRTSPSTGGSTCGVIGNNPSQGQTEISPNAVMQDKIFMSALLMGDALVTVQVGNGNVVNFQGRKGINHWSLPFNGQTGQVVFRVVRNGKVVKSGTGKEITGKTALESGCTNYNAWVGGF